MRSRVLLRLLVAFEILADYLDCTSERAASNGIENGRQLHRALIDALDPHATLADYYLHHPWSNDGGYLRALIATCQQACSELPSYQTVRPRLLMAARLTEVLALNHDPHPERRDKALRAWAHTHFPDQHELAWWERTAAASAWLTILALLALGADPDSTETQARDVYDAYLPWISLLGTLLDSYGDIAEDARDEDHSYVAHYASLPVFSQRVIVLIRRTLDATGGLPARERHMVLVNCMIAMYLSKDSTRSVQARKVTAQLACASGPLTLLLLPVLRAWRALYKQQSR